MLQTQLKSHSAHSRDSTAGDAIKIIRVEERSPLCDHYTVDHNGQELTALCFPPGVVSENISAVPHFAFRHVYGSTMLRNKDIVLFEKLSSDYLSLTGLFERNSSAGLPTPIICSIYRKFLAHYYTPKRFTASRPTSIRRVSSSTRTQCASNCCRPSGRRTRLWSFLISIRTTSPSRRSSPGSP